jgi:hypothetical protein
MCSSGIFNDKLKMLGLATFYYIIEKFYFGASIVKINKINGFKLTFG